MNEFSDITIRGRMAFGICCIENSIRKFGFEDLDWSLLFNFLWRYPSAPEIKDLAKWAEQEGECRPFCVLENKPYKELYFEFLTEEQFLKFRKLYGQVNHEICALIDLTIQIGTQALYGGVRDGSPATLDYLEQIKIILHSNGIEEPAIAFFKEFCFRQTAENDWKVWGDKIAIEKLKLISRTIPANYGH
ncbi:MAG: hypothetical protein ACTHJT_14280 [Cytophaga sp.]|uniref:hypothetical protein n=1 Tax=Cytophaga sp. TaxID=29535 RepID=UPI003F7F3B46